MSVHQKVSCTVLKWLSLHPEKVCPARRKGPGTTQLYQSSLGSTIPGAGERMALLCTQDSSWLMLPYTEERKPCSRRPSYGGWRHCVSQGSSRNLFLCREQMAQSNQDNLRKV